jgi:hypothetical protein
MRKNSERIGWPVTVLVMIALAILVGLALALKFDFFPRSEIYIGMLTVLGVGILMLLLTIMTMVFASLDLADPNHALGLPEGSIRALIALILLLVFIIVGLYLFNVVGTGAARPEAERLAQQLFTTIGTLVVAVAGFYFGATAVSAARGVSVPSVPVIRTIDPTEGKPGDAVPVKILGKGFSSPRAVRLVSGSSEILGTGILSSDSEIHCVIKIPPETPVNTMWDLIVMNEDGGNDMLTRAFSM